MMNQLLGIVACMSVASANGPAEVTVFERSSRTLTNTRLILVDDNPYLPVKMLVEQFDLESKTLPNDQVGICRDDRCVPFSTGSGKDDLRTEGGKTYVPVERLVKGLGGTHVWDATSQTLLMDLTPRHSHNSTNVGKKLDAMLTDLEGTPVKLSSFRGKRMVLFAWASW